MGAANHGPRKARAFRHATFVELNKNRVREPVDPRLEAANPVAQALRQHWDDTVGEINAVAAAPRLAVQGAARLRVRGNIGDVHAELPAAIRKPRNVNGVIEIPGVVGIDGDDELVAQIFASDDLLRINVFWNTL